MTMPENARDATRYVVVVSERKGDETERATYTFERNATIQDVFDTVFAEGRVGWPGRTLPYEICLLPDLTTIPTPKTLLETLSERDAETLL